MKTTYWAIVIAVSVVGFAFCWAILTSKWRKISGAKNGFEKIQTMIVHMSKVLYGMPGDQGYMDLKFSLLRHAFIFAVFSVVIYFAGKSWISVVLLVLSLIYSYIPYLRYRSRIDLVNELIEEDGKTEVAKQCRQATKDSLVVVFYSFAAMLSLFVLYNLI